MTKVAQLTQFTKEIIFAVALSTFLFFPTFSFAASYAYVSATGEIKVVIADDWMSAVSTAPNIHQNSGVFAISEVEKFSFVGKTVESVK